MAKKNKTRIRADGVALCVLKVKVTEEEKSTYEGHAKKYGYPSFSAWSRRAWKLQLAREAGYRLTIPLELDPNDVRQMEMGEKTKGALRNERRKS